MNGIIAASLANANATNNLHNACNNGMTLSQAAAESPLGFALLCGLGHVVALVALVVFLYMAWGALRDALNANLVWSRPDNIASVVLFTIGALLVLSVWLLAMGV